MNFPIELDDCRASSQLPDCGNEGGDMTSRAPIVVVSIRLLNASSGTIWGDKHQRVTIESKAGDLRS